MKAANIDGSRNVVRACAAVGVRRLVYTSSAASIGEEEGTVGDERSPHRGWFLSGYERSKYLAEQAVFAERTPVEVVAVNPSSVQGPGRASGTGKLILQVIDGRLPVLVDTRVSMVDIDDCARGHLLAEANGTPGQRYILNGFTLDIRQALDLLERVTGRRAKVRFLPGWVALAGAGAYGAVSRLIGRHPRFCWGRHPACTMLHGHAYDGSRATRDLGLAYTPAGETLSRLFVRPGAGPGWAADQCGQDMTPPGPTALTPGQVNDYFHSGYPSAAESGIRCDDLGDGWAQARWTYNPNQLRPGGYISGPTQFTLADTAIWFAVFTVIGIAPMAVTTDLSISFLAPRHRRRSPGTGRTRQGGADPNGGPRLLLWVDGARDRPVSHAIGSYARPQDL